MSTLHPANNDTIVDSTPSFDQAPPASPTSPSFLKGELTTLWPVLVLAVLMLLVILWDRFVRF